MINVGEKRARKMENLFDWFLFKFIASIMEIYCIVYFFIQGFETISLMVAFIFLFEAWASYKLTGYLETNKNQRIKKRRKIRIKWW